MFFSPVCNLMNSPLFKTLPLCVAVALAPMTLRAEPTDELIAKGDACAVKFHAADALKCFLSAEKLEPNNARLQVRISREYRHLMSDATKPEEKLSLGNTAVVYANRAAALDPNDPEAQLAVAISYGKLEPLEGNREKLDGARIIKKAADKVIKLDPSNDLAWHVLGRWHVAFAEVSAFERALAKIAYGKLPDSTYDDAARCFEKAIALNPNRLMHYIELGRVYADIGRNNEARIFITKGLGMPDTEKDDPETKRQGKEMLAKLP
jgi:tetratricopeptide (TPR) repeat protein